jgi:hypothetical protein
MKSARMALGAVALACGAMLAAPVFAQQEEHFRTVTPEQLKWGDSPALPGAKVAVIEGPLNEAKPFTIRIKFPANYKVAPHVHSGIEHVTVLSGTFRVGHGEKFDAKKTNALGAGSIAIMQPKTAHFVWIEKETEVQVHGVGPWTLTFVNPADDPRKQQ